MTDYPHRYGATDRATEHYATACAGSAANAVPIGASTAIDARVAPATSARRTRRAGARRTDFGNDDARRIEMGLGMVRLHLACFRGRER